MPFLIPAGLAASIGGAGGAAAGASSLAGATALGAGTTAALTTTTSVLGGLSLASGLISSAGSFLQGRYQESASNAQAQELRQQADLDVAASSAKMAADDYKASNLISAISANTAASGVTPEGSPNLVSRTSLQEQRISDTYTRYSGQLASMRDMYKAALAKSQGQEQYAGGVIGAVGGLLTSGVKTAGIFSGKFANPYLGIV